MLSLVYRGQTTVPVEVEGILPEVVRDKSSAEIEKLPIFHGNRQVALGDFFAVSGDPADERIEWSGALSGVHWIGAKMTRGVLHVTGDAGRHVGSEMKGGEVRVDGNVGDWVGGEMHGGLIHVRGDAGHQVGAAYRGSAKGMTRGTILIGGSAGNEIGHTMRRGLICIGGKAGDLVGFNMRAGTILIFGESGIRHGAGMRRGTIAFVGGPVPPLLPSFKLACRYRPEFLSMIYRDVRRLGFDVPESHLTAEYDLYSGDLIEGGRGEILVRRN